MNTSASRKRNRSDNFDVDDVELLLNLVSEHTELIDSPKLDLKKQGWDSICTKYNANCTGIKRDLNALKLKIKNMKAQSKKTKMKMEMTGNTTPDPLSNITTTLNGEGGENDEEEEYEMDTSLETDTKPLIGNGGKIRKRCKKFTKEECDLLLKLHEKYCVGLDSSSTPNSVKRRSDAWETLTNDFNEQQTTGIMRECNELKIKFKNLKALRIKTEPSETSERIMGNSHMFNESDTSMSGTKGVIEERKLITPRPIRVLQGQANPPKNFGEMVGAISTPANDIYYDDDFEEDFHRDNSKNTASAEDKEVEKIRKENILLKNAVLRKKERLLELQIALAERNLRRQL